MPIALLLFGALFLTAAVRGEHEKLFATLKDDFTGPNNFWLWLVAIWGIGAVGYYKPLKPLSIAFMTLVVVVMFLAHRGFFARFMEQIGATQGTAQNGLNYGFSTEKFKQPDSLKKAIDAIHNSPITGAIGKIL